jgi:hypothetical protein
MCLVCPQVVVKIRKKKVLIKWRVFREFYNSLFANYTHMGEANTTNINTIEHNETVAQLKNNEIQHSNIYVNF